MRAGRQSQLAGRSRLGSLREALTDTSVSMQAERERMAALKERQTLVVSSFNLFPTPPEIADRMASLFDEFGNVLEPSAGTGRLYEAVRRQDTLFNIDLIDISPECCAVLEQIREAMGDSASIERVDFLAVKPRPGYDSIIMNPPFKNGADIKHILHASKFLRPGGRLVSLIANGPRQRARLEPIASEWIDLPDCSFKSEGTDVATAMIVIDVEVR